MNRYPNRSETNSSKKWQKSSTLVGKLLITNYLLMTIWTKDRLKFRPQVAWTCVILRDHIKTKQKLFLRKTWNYLISLNIERNKVSLENSVFLDSDYMHRLIRDRIPEKNDISDSDVTSRFVDHLSRRRCVLSSNCLKCPGEKRVYSRDKRVIGIMELSWHQILSENIILLNNWFQKKQRSLWKRFFVLLDFAKCHFRYWMYCGLKNNFLFTV